MDETTRMNLTPNAGALVAYARSIQRDAPAGSKDAATAERILRECGIDSPLHDKADASADIAQRSQA